MRRHYPKVRRPLNPICVLVSILQSTSPTPCDSSRDALDVGSANGATGFLQSTYLPRSRMRNWRLHADHVSFVFVRSSVCWPLFVPIMHSHFDISFLFTCADARGSMSCAQIIVCMYVLLHNCCWTVIICRRHLLIWFFRAPC